MTALIASALAVCALGASPSAEVAAAPPGPTLPVEFDLSRYQPVDPERYRSLAYADNGRGFLRVGRWMCQIGPVYRYVGCQGHPATAPPQVRGAAISGDQQGPWWVPPGTTYRFGAPTGFRPPTLSVGSRVTLYGVTCTAPRRDTVACRTGSRALIFTPGWHKFFFPSGDSAHSPNPAPRYLPPRLQYWNQLPLNPPPPR
ncbi:hypothetical protein VZC37_17345 [Gordonia sp. LSe1-13]|uniref:Secreted protein n=1 Tax=Gordonia sesuvii TaxID=3116777 RepID=A0ABU7MHR9_9ACTN|nr:hypothetical protein [Gordonia sp. LSe1-13]